MLQQTQVATVVTGYERFLCRFPTVTCLAQAEESEVLRAWQGLGYYRRARNLHRAAQRVVTEHGGVFPRDPASLVRLPGIGRYTANAIACFAFGQPVPILEANTIRLWTRVCAAEGDPNRSSLSGQLWQLAEQVLPRRRVADFNQALMDLGALVCTPRQPACTACPIRSQCQATAAGMQERFPQTSGKPRTVDVDHVTVVLRAGERVLLTQRPDDGRWAGLWEFPRVERDGSETWQSAARRAIRSATGRSFRLGPERLTLRHGIMHYRVRLKCFDARLVGRVVDRDGHNGNNDCCRWVRVEELSQMPMSSPQRRIAQTLSAAPRQD